MEQHLEGNSCALTLCVDRTAITAADTVRALLEVSAPEDCEVVFPEVLDQLGEFTVLDTYTPSPVLGGQGRLVHARTYVLEPFLPDTYSIPPLEVVVKDSDRGILHSFHTDSIEIKVSSLLDGEDGEAKEIAGVTGPVGLPKPVPWRLYAAAGAGILVVVSLLVWWALRSRDRAEVYVPPADQVALQALDALWAEGLVEKNEFKEFYYRVSDVLRRFLESRFSFHAPERTTEEFLVELSESNVLKDDRKQVLREFLRFCDLVKFAKHEPVREDARNAFDTCRRFVFEAGSGEPPGPLGGTPNAAGRNA